MATKLATKTKAVQPAPSQEILTIDEAAAYLRAKPNTLRGYIYEKRFTAADGLRYIGKTPVVFFPTLRERVAAGTLMVVFSVLCLISPARGLIAGTAAMRMLTRHGEIHTTSALAES